MKHNRKIIGILLAVMIASMSVMGCTSVENTDVVVTVGGEEVTYEDMNFYATFLAAYYESYYYSYFGDTMWETEVSDGVTYEDSVKDEAMTTMQEIIVVRQHAEELGVSLTDEEVAEIAATAEAFVAANESELLDLVSGSVESVTELLTLFEIDSKCTEEIIKDVDTVVSDEEAAQKKATYVYAFMTVTDEDGNSTDMTEDEIAQLETDLAELLADAKSSGDLYSLAEELGYNVLETTFDSENTSLNADLLTALDSLEEGEFTDVIATDYAYYIGQLTSEMDEDATESMKESIISERESTLYDETVAAWLAEVEVVINESVWKAVDFSDVQITMYYEDTTTEESTEESTEEITEESTEE